MNNSTKMWIQVRSMDGKKSVRIDNLSKLTKIEELREMLIEHFDAEPKCQRLFYRGKQVCIPCPLNNVEGFCRPKSVNCQYSV